MMKRATSSPRRWVFRALVLFWGGVAIWVGVNLQARGLADDVFVGDERTAVAIGDEGYAFLPTADTAGAGLIFYPGALVDPRAYAPLARAIARRGYPVKVLRLPYRLAPTAAHEAALATRTLDAMREGGPGRAWVVGGHSKGGKLAALFARDHPGALGGLLLLGTSHPRRDDLSGLGVDVAKVYGSRDGLASEEEVRQFATNLPTATRFTRVDGGNHAQFGWYGRQVGDRAAAISREEQQRQTVGAIVDQLRRVSAARVPH